MGRPSIEALFDRHHRAVYRFLLRSTGEVAAAEDLCQEVFLRVLAALDRYQPHEREESWVFRIARNLLTDRWRSRARRPPLAPADAARAVPLRPRQPLQAALQQALDALAVDEREAFLLREVAGLGYREIADLCGITADAARMRIYRARMALRHALGGEIGRSRTAPPEEARG